MPFYYRKNEDDDSFKFEIAGTKTGWSLDALKWVSVMAYHPKFRKPNGDRYPMFCCVTGEKEVTVNDHTYKIDGMVQTDEKTYFLEFFGCRLYFKNLVYKQLF